MGKEYFEDDSCVISEEVRQMSKQERKKEIEKLESIAKSEREKILKQKREMATA